MNPESESNNPTITPTEVSTTDDEKSNTPSFLPGDNASPPDGLPPNWQDAFMQPAVDDEPKISDMPTIVASRIPSETPSLRPTLRPTKVPIDSAGSGISPHPDITASGSIHEAPDPSDIQKLQPSQLPTLSMYDLYFPAYKADDDTAAVASSSSRMRCELRWVVNGILVMFAIIYWY
jgi:hypothetical protein